MQPYILRWLIYNHWVRYNIAWPLTTIVNRCIDNVINGEVLQCAKKEVSDSLGLVDFAIGLVNSVINLPDGQVNFFGEFKLQMNCEINLLIKTFLGLAEMIFGLVNVSFSLPEWQAIKMTFFAPWVLPLSHNNNIVWIFLSDTASVGSSASERGPGSGRSSPVVKDKKLFKSTGVKKDVSSLG